MKKKSNPKEGRVKQQSMVNITKDDIKLDESIPMYFEPGRFLAHAKSLSKEQKQQYLDEMRSEKNFQVKITMEDYRVKNPNGYRYIQAEKIIDILNVNGKALKTLIDQE